MTNQYTNRFGAAKLKSAIERERRDKEAVIRRLLNMLDNKERKESREKIEHTKLYI